jgi:hypothetical protein
VRFTTIHVNARFASVAADRQKALRTRRCDQFEATAEKHEKSVK